MPDATRSGQNPPPLGPTAPDGRAFTDRAHPAAA